MSTRRFAGQTVAITGGGQGLGLGMARAFAAEGAHVCVAEIQKGLASTVAADLTAEYGIACSGRQVDVTQPDQVHDWIEETVSTFSRLDVLVNNAGIIRDGRIENLSDDDWDQVVAVSLTGAFYCSRAAVPHMKKAGYGRILSFSSMSWRGNFGQANYVAAKAGVVGLARGIALDHARSGITSNVIAPGLIETPMLASMNGAARDKLISRVPMQHTGDPADIAAAAVFLCSKSAGYITGVVLDVDGGISIGSSLR